MGPENLTPEDELLEIATWFGWSKADTMPPEPGQVLEAVHDLMSSIDKRTSEQLKIRRCLDSGA